MVLLVIETDWIDDFRTFVMKYEVNNETRLKVQSSFSESQEV